jgi:hypothetical protein
LRLLRHGSFVGLGDVLASFRISATSWSAVLAGRQVSQGQAFLRACANTHAGPLHRGDVPLGQARALGLTVARLGLFAAARTAAWRHRRHASDADHAL